MSIFLSHNHADKDMVRRIGLRLQKRDANVWIDEAEIKAGDSLIEKISDGLTNCKYVLAFLSKNSINSPWVKKELSIAITREIKGKIYKVIPILLDEIEKPTFLEDKLYIDFTNSKDYQSNFDKLLFALDIEKFFKVEKSNLELLDYHAAIKNKDNIVVLASCSSVEDDYAFRNPDGTKYPLKDMYIIRVLDGNFNYHRFTSIRFSHGCLSEIDKYYVIFSNFKQHDGTYDMNGYKWFLRKSNLTIKRIDKVFENQNRGWYPIFNKLNDVIHLNYDGYHRCFNNIQEELIDPVEMEKQHVKYLSNISDGEIPNSSFHLAEVLRKIIL